MMGVKENDGSLVPPARYQFITQFYRYRHFLNFSRHPFQKTSSPGILIANFPNEKYLGRHVIRN